MSIGAENPIIEVSPMSSWKTPLKIQCTMADRNANPGPNANAKATSSSVSFNDDNKPFILICATPAHSHLVAAAAIAKDLIKRDFNVTFLNVTSHRHFIESTGARFAPLLDEADVFLQGDIADLHPQKDEISGGIERMAFDMRKIFVPPIAAQFKSVLSVLRGFKERDEKRPVVVLNESLFWGAIPLKLGACESELQPEMLISFGGIPLPLSSVDTAPFGLGLLPDGTEEGRRQIAALRRTIQDEVFAETQQDFQSVLQSTGASECPHFILDALCLLSDRFIQLCHPALEYPRSDAPTSIIFGGTIPHSHETVWQDKPEWWSEITLNPEKKHIIFVSQGTVALNYSDLIIPTLKALKDRPNTLVIVAVGSKETSLPPNTEIPNNARIANFIPYHEILRHTDVFISNGGYGGFLQSVSNGVPIIIAGETEDKPEVAARAEYSGVGINLRTRRPKEQNLRVAVEETLGNSKYGDRAKKLGAEMRELDPFEVIVRCIYDVVAQRNVERR